jgi:hypothetical protein
MSTAKQTILLYFPEKEVPMRTVQATRYITALREGGSLPAVIEADDGAQYVVKFRGAAQGPKALIAELVCGRIAHALGLPMPELVFVELNVALGRAEPNPEIRDIILASDGLNVALAYLPGSLAYTPLLAPPPDAALASRIVWFDALITNIDRSAANPNLLLWGSELWLIDNAAALYVQYSWGDYLQRARARFPQIRDHVLLPLASQLAAADAELSALLTPAVIEEVVALIPPSWLEGDTTFADEGEHRQAYARYLLARLEAPRGFVEEASNARAALV